MIGQLGVWYEALTKCAKFSQDIIRALIGYRSGYKFFCHSMAASVDLFFSEYDY